MAWSDKLTNNKAITKNKRLQLREPKVKVILLFICLLSNNLEEMKHLVAWVCILK